LNRHITIGQIDIDNDGVIGREELEVFVTFYNSFVDDFVLLKRLLWFLCLAVFLCMCIIVAVLIPLNFLATEVNNNGDHQVTDRNGTPLAILQGYTTASSFDCSHTALISLQYLFISDQHKESVLGVEVIPRDGVDPTTSAFTDLAVVTTVKGDYLIPCAPESRVSKRDDDKKKDKAANWRAYIPTCGNAKIDDQEECDEDTQDEDSGDHICDRKVCYCKEGYYLFKDRKCKPLCGNGKVDQKEQCDGTEGCKKCVCKEGWEPYLAADLNINGTFSPTNTSLCRRHNYCNDPNYCDDPKMTCSWDGKKATCSCDSSIMKTVTYQPPSGDKKQKCVFKNPCKTILNTCTVARTCDPITDISGAYTGAITCPEWNPDDDN